VHSQELVVLLRFFMSKLCGSVKITTVVSFMMDETNKEGTSWWSTVSFKKVRGINLLT